MNIQQALKQAQNLQSKMADMQKKLEDVLVEGQAGGGLVKVVATCKGVLKKVDIDASLLSSDEKEMLEDLIVAAINNAKLDADKKTAESMKQISSSMGLPENMMNLNNFFGG